MKVKCDYCGAFIEESDEICAYCRKPNNKYKPSSNERPQTIDELKKWYIDRNMPPENVTRFFIGKDIKESKAFGIYKDEFSGNYVVYKNKADGTRAIRYEGQDESYAVNELYMRLKEEIENQKNNNLRYGNNYKNGKKVKLSSIITILIIPIAILIIIAAIFMDRNSPKEGYYRYRDDYYYYQSGSWYGYRNYDGWYYTSAPYELKTNYNEYYQSRNYEHYYPTTRFENSRYYREESSHKVGIGDWSHESSWDSSDSWDSDATDWDSDW